MLILVFATKAVYYAYYTSLKHRREPAALGRLRDSKNPTGGHLALSPAAWSAFLSAS